MAKILILGGGFGGVVAAETLAKKLGPEHKITLVSRSSRFTFYPALVRVAFGKCEPDDVSFNLRQTMLERNVGFIEGEVARIEPLTRQVVVAHGDVQGTLKYDYLILALGRRLATEQVSGFFEHSHHLLSVKAALTFGDAVRDFHKGHAVIGQCPGARLPVPVFETAFALADLAHRRGDGAKVKITVIDPDPDGRSLLDDQTARSLRLALCEHDIEFVPGFAVRRVTAGQIHAADKQKLDCDLLMLVPPFRGPSAVRDLGITDDEGYVRVDPTMRVRNLERVYAVGDAVSLEGPKLGYQAVLEAEVAAENLLLELNGMEPLASYDHALRLVIDEGGGKSIYVHQGLGDDDFAVVRQGNFWRWAKRIQEKYWLARHS